MLERLRAGDRAVLRDVANEDDRDPSPLASSISRSADSRTWPTLPAGPSSSSTVIVWIESTMTTIGEVARATSTTRPTSAREDGDGIARRPPVSPRRRRAEPDLGGGLLAADVEHVAIACGATTTPAAACSSSVDLPTPGSPRRGRASRARGRRRARGPARGSGRGCGRRQGSRCRPADRCRAGSRAAAPARPRSAASRRADDRLDEGVPGRARAALALPAQEIRAAGLADEAGLGPGHGERPRRLRRASSPRRLRCAARCRRRPCRRRSWPRPRSG